MGRTARSRLGRQRVVHSCGELNPNPAGPFQPLWEVMVLSNPLAVSSARSPAEAPSRDILLLLRRPFRPTHCRSGNQSLWRRVDVVFFMLTEGRSKMSDHTDVPDET